METEPTTDNSPLVPIAVKSCLDCRYSGFSPTAERLCLATLTKGHSGYPTCLQQRTTGECGPTGSLFNKRTVFVPSPPPPVVRPAPPKSVQQWRALPMANADYQRQNTIHPSELWAAIIITGLVTAVGTYLFTVSVLSF